MHAKSLQSCLILCDPMDCSPPGSSVQQDFPGKNTGVGCHALLQGIFLTQGWNPHFLCLLHWQVSSLSLVPPGKLLAGLIWYKKQLETIADFFKGKQEENNILCWFIIHLSSSLNVQELWRPWGTNNAQRPAYAWGSQTVWVGRQACSVIS